MRDILFRGWSIIQDKWVYGYLYNLERVGFFIKEINGYTYPIDKKSIGQYVGLEDCSNTKIFEGDIMYDEFGEIGVVEWYNQEGGFFCNGDTLRDLIINEAYAYDNKYERGRNNG